MELKQLIDALNDARERLGDDAQVVFDVRDIDTDLPLGVQGIDVYGDTLWILSEDPE